MKFSFKEFFFLLCFPVFCFAKPFEGTKFVISGPSPHSPMVAKTLFNQGGNILDMAVGSALALAVTHPYYVSLGCGGFALIKKDSFIEALDFRETAPYKMSSDFFQKESLSSREGGASVGVPGFVAGMWELHKKYGKLSWSKVIQPAILLAEKGFPVSGDWVEISKQAGKKFNVSGKKIFFKKEKAYKPNEVWRQPKLAKALRLLQKQKAKAFYRGAIGKDVISSVRKNKGIFTEEDLKRYKVRWLKPVSIFFRGYQIYSMPLPSSGGLILSRALKLMEKQKLYKKELYSLEELHLFSEILSRAFRPRFLMGDPDFIKADAKDWLSNQSLEDINKSISLKKVHRLKPLKESEETTHLSLLDLEGNAVSMTLTLNGYYGSHIVSEKYGIVLNNQMDDFTTFPDKANMFGLFQGKNNRIQGGKRPLSSMTPVIVEKNKRTVLVIGGAGGPKIISGVLQSLYRHLINKMDIEQALISPRLHHQFLPRKLYIEDKRFNPELILNLKMKGHDIRFERSMAQVFAVSRDKEGRLFSAHENRREGASGGL